MISGSSSPIGILDIITTRLNWSENIVGNTRLLTLIRLKSGFNGDFILSLSTKKRLQKHSSRDIKLTMTKSGSDLNLSNKVYNKCESEVHTFVFDQVPNVPLTSQRRRNTKRFTLRSELWQIIPSFIASLFAVSFGMMLGWPSPTYIKLFAPDAPVPITLEVSPLIAGLLMIGTIVATPFSSWRQLSPKYGILSSLIIMTIGWILTWQSAHFFWLLGSRFLIGIGNGFATGQIKLYIADICTSAHLKEVLNKCINFHVITGVLIAFSVGPFIEFRTFALMSCFLTSGIFFLCFLVPHSPNELVRYNKDKEARRMIELLQPELNAEEEIIRLVKSQANPTEELTICDLLRNGTHRINLLKLVILTFFQQFCGIPATIVYCQFILTQLNCPYPEYLAIVYIVIFFLSNFAAAFFLNHLNKKTSLIISGVSVFIVLSIHVAVLHFQLTTNIEYVSFLLMCLFIISHTLGLGTVPFALIPGLFPSSAKTTVSQLQVMFFCLFAILVTKIFQVLYSAFCLYVPFSMFATVAVVSVFFVSLCIPEAGKKNNLEKYTSGNIENL